MPCNSDYMEPSNLEQNAAHVACLLDELEGYSINPRHWEGYHPKTYCKTTKASCDLLVSTLCQKLQTLDVTKQSLEMQIWWRDHQKADKLRLEKELQEKQQQADKQTALAKLTPYERKLLGY